MLRAICTAIVVLPVPCAPPISSSSPCPHAAADGLVQWREAEWHGLVLVDRSLADLVGKGAQHFGRRSRLDHAEAHVHGPGTVLGLLPATVDGSGCRRLWGRLRRARNELLHRLGSGRLRQVFGRLSRGLAASRPLRSGSRPSGGHRSVSERVGHREAEPGPTAPVLTAQGPRLVRREQPPRRQGHWEPERGRSSGLAHGRWSAMAQTRSREPAHSRWSEPARGHSRGLGA